MRGRKNSLDFLSLHAFFNFRSAAFKMAAFTRRTWEGQRLTHCMQEIQAFLSHFRRLSDGIAFTGHFLAHSPHPVQALPADGVMGRVA